MAERAVDYFAAGFVGSLRQAFAKHLHEWREEVGCLLVFVLVHFADLLHKLGRQELRSDL